MSDDNRLPPIRSLVGDLPPAVAQPYYSATPRPNGIVTPQQRITPPSTTPRRDQSHTAQIPRSDSTRPIERPAAAPKPPPETPGALADSFINPMLRRHGPIEWNGKLTRLPPEKRTVMEVEIRIPFDYECDRCRRSTTAGTKMRAQREKAHLPTVCGKHLITFIYHAVCIHCENKVNFFTNPFHLSYSAGVGMKAGSAVCPSPRMYVHATFALQQELERPVHEGDIIALGSFDGIHGIELAVYLCKLEMDRR